MLLSLNNSPSWLISSFTSTGCFSIHYLILLLHIPDISFFSSASSTWFSLFSVSFFASTVLTDLFTRLGYEWSFSLLSYFHNVCLGLRCITDWATTCSRWINHSTSRTSPSTYYWFRFLDLIEFNFMRNIWFWLICLSRE